MDINQGINLVQKYSNENQNRLNNYQKEYDSENHDISRHNKHQKNRKQKNLNFE